PARVAEADVTPTAATPTGHRPTASRAGEGGMPAFHHEHRMSPRKAVSLLPDVRLRYTKLSWGALWPSTAGGAAAGRRSWGLTGGSARWPRARGSRPA